MRLEAATFLLVCCTASATTHTVYPRQSTESIQRVISNASPGDTVSFVAGTYNISGVLRLKCGVTYTAAVQATPSNVILNGTFPAETADIFDLAGGCNHPTTVSYLSSLHGGMLYVATPNYGLTFTHNQAGDLKCCKNEPADPALFFASQDGNPKNMLTMATVTWNQLGDSTSCTAPMNAMTDFDSPENYQGACAGIIIQTSVNGMVIENNVISHVGEGIHVVCSGKCYPDAYTTRNLTVRYNDFNQIHRMAYEQQPQTTSGVDFEFNSMHDWVNGYFGSFGMSFACCGQGATAPYLNASNNLIVLNVVPHYMKPYGYGYASEDMGLKATYNHNWIGSGNFYLGAPGMAWGYGPVGDMSYNTVCGNAFVVGGFITKEFDYNVGPTTNGNVTAKVCSPVQSVAPSISPASGAQSFPLKVTLHDPGYTSGPQPLANTGIWYTTDGSNPVPGAGTAQYLADGATFTLKAPTTVKAVGMWGAANQPASYDKGFGFVPSAVKSATYTAGGPGQGNAQGTPQGNNQPARRR